MSEHRQGPVRSEAARVAILEATARLFAARGYDHLTMEGIAAEAGVGKQTIYRWWPSKGAVVADCMLEDRLMPKRFALRNSGDVREDLIAWLAEIFSVLDQPGGEALMRSIVAAAAENAGVGQRLHQTLGAEESLTERLQAAVDTGDLRPDAPLTEIGDALIGAVILRSLSRTSTDLESVRRLIDVVLGPVQTRS